VPFLNCAPVVVWSLPQSQTQRHAARRARPSYQLPAGARTSNRPKRWPAISMIKDDMARAVQMDSEKKVGLTSSRG
jgi:hypothetical protein